MRALHRTDKEARHHADARDQPSGHRCAAQRDPETDDLGDGRNVEVTGSIASSSLTTVNANAALTGVGTVGNTTIASGGIFAPGDGAPGSSMALTGNLALQSGAFYMV